MLGLSGQRSARAGLVALVAAMLLTVPSAAAQPAGAGSLRGADLLGALRAGGLILYFRHADTDHSQKDARMGSVEDCASQRNLTDRGRDHARAIGEDPRARD